MRAIANAIGIAADRKSDTRLSVGSEQKIEI
jgi:hypothetical protein